MSYFFLGNARTEADDPLLLNAEENLRTILRGVVVALDEESGSVVMLECDECTELLELERERLSIRPNDFLDAVDEERGRPIKPNEKRRAGLSSSSLLPSNVGGDNGFNGLCGTCV